MKPIKILATAPNLITGGAEKQLVYLMDRLAKTGFNIVLLLFELEGEYLAEVPKEVKILSPRSPRPREVLKGIWKIKEIIRAISKEKPDILYSRLWPTKAATAFAGFLLGKPVVFSEDRTLRRYIDENNTGKRMFNFYLRKIASRLADVIVPVSQGIADEIEQILNVNPKRINLIYNGFDLEEMWKKAAEEVNHPSLGNRKELVVGTLGRMVELKGFNYLLEAVMLVNDKGISLRLLMIGKGELLEELKVKAERLGIKDKVNFLGFVKNPFAYLVRCDLFVLSSLYEGLPSTLIEAMALGLPVISTRCPTGPEEIIQNEKNGLLVPVADSRAIAEAIVRVLEDKELNTRLRIEGKKRAEDFSLNIMVSKFAEIFTSLSTK